jgi:hypothetical protein
VKRALHGVGLFRRGKELQLGDQLHTFIVLKGCDMYRHNRHTEYALKRAQAVRSSQGQDAWVSAPKGSFL